MNYVEKIRLFGTIIVGFLAIFWSTLVSIQPNPIIKIITFSGLLSVSSFVFLYPLIQSLKICELKKINEYYLTELCQGLGEGSQ